MRFVDRTNPRDLLNAGLDSFARLAGISAAEGDYDQMRFVIDKIKSVYANLMKEPVSTEWESLPKPSRILKETSEAFAAHCISRSPAEDRSHYVQSVDSWLRETFITNCRALRSVAAIQCVQTDTLHKLALNLMLERDKAVDTARATARPILGPLGRRLADARAQQIARDFLSDPKDALATAAVHTTRTLIKEIKKGVSKGDDPVGEVRVLANMAGQVLVSDHPIMAEITSFLAANPQDIAQKAA